MLNFFLKSKRSKRIIKNNDSAEVSPIIINSNNDIAANITNNGTSIDTHSIEEHPNSPTTIGSNIENITGKLVDLTENNSKKEVIEDVSIENNHLIINQLTELCKTVESLISSTNWKPTKAKIEEIQLKWIELDPDSKIVDLKSRFETARNSFMIKFELHLAAKKEIKEREQLCEELNSLTLTANCVSSISRFNEIKVSWNNDHNIPVRFYEILDKKFNILSLNFNEAIELQKQEEISKAAATEKLEELCSLAETLSEKNITNLKLAEKEVGILRTKWVNITNSVLAIDLEIYAIRFNAAIDSYLDNKIQIIKLSEEKEAEITTFVLDLLKKLEELNASENIKSVLFDIKEIQHQWEKLEYSNVKEQYSEQFKKMFRQYFSKFKFIQQKDEWQRWENYTNKLLLCERAEKHLENKDIYKVSREINEIWNQWRKIGQAPREKNDIIWERFKTVRQKINVICQSFFKELDQHKIKNLEIKTNLCLESEKLNGSNEWEDTAKALKEIQEKWKKVGRAPQPQDDELYQRLRTVCNTFFERRAAFYSDMHKRQSKNKASKKNICTQAEELVNLHWRDAFKKIKELRNKWKLIPSASRNDEQLLWSSFNCSIEKFIQKIEDQRPENLIIQQNLIVNAEKILLALDNENDCNHLNNTIDDLCNQWEATGPVPKEKEKELCDSFYEVIDSLADAYQKSLAKNHALYRKRLLHKEQMIEQVELFFDPKDSDFINNQNSVKAIQEEWAKYSNSNKLSTEEIALNKKFEDACSAFFNHKAAYFDQMIDKRQKNLKAKRKLCIQLEKLAGINMSHKDIFQTHKSHNIADEIKFAIETNFAAKHDFSEEEIIKKFNILHDKWNNIGSIPIDSYEKIYLRYDQACDLLKIKLGKKLNI